MTQPQHADVPFPGVPMLLLGTAMVLVDIVAIYVLLATGGLPSVVVYGVTGLVAIVVGGSFLAVVVGLLGTDPASGPEPSLIARGAQVVVSVSVLTGVTYVVGYGGGLVLALSAALGGPDPETADGELLRDRLLDWPERNREFMRTDGHGELPLRP